MADNLLETGAGRGAIGSMTSDHNRGYGRPQRRRQKTEKENLYENGASVAPTISRDFKFGS